MAITDSRVILPRLLGSKNTGNWTRPNDWLVMPTVNDAEQKFVGLHAIFEDANFVALVCQGAYTVDWGDGTVENFASGVTAYHEYNYATYDTSNNTLCSRGYKQAIVTVTPQAGQNLNNFKLGVKHNKAGLINGYTTGWLDIILNLPQATNNGISLYISLAVHRILEKVNFKNIGYETNMSNMFNSCFSLQSVSLNIANVTDMNSMFSSCYSLQSVSLNTANVITTTSMFYFCYSLQSVSLNTANVTDMNSMFNSCYALQSVILNTANVITTTSMFNSCYALQSVSLDGLSTNSSLENCKLSANALNKLFTSLGTVSGKTITISSNYGASTCNRSIATAKGWTVTG